MKACMRNPRKSLCIYKRLGAPTIMSDNPMIKDKFISCFMFTTNLLKGTFLMIETVYFSQRSIDN